MKYIHSLRFYPEDKKELREIIKLFANKSVKTKINEIILSFKSLEITNFNFKQRISARN